MGSAPRRDGVDRERKSAGRTERIPEVESADNRSESTEGVAGVLPQDCCFGRGTRTTVAQSRPSIQQQQLRDYRAPGVWPEELGNEKVPGSVGFLPPISAGQACRKICLDRPPSASGLP